MAWGHSTQECFHGQCEACKDAPLPYHAVTWWVRAFQEGRDAIQDYICTGWPHVENNTVHLLASLLDADCRWTACDLAAEVWVCHIMVLVILGSCKLVACLIPHEISEVQQWATLCSHTGLVEPVPEGGYDFLGRIVTMDKTWARSYEPNLKCQSNEWKYPSSPHPKKVYSHNVLWRWCSLWHDTDRVILYYTVPPRQKNAAYYCTFLQHHLRPALRRKRWHLVVQNTIIQMIMQGVTPLLLS